MQEPRIVTKLKAQPTAPLNAPHRTGSIQPLLRRKLAQRLFVGVALLASIACSPKKDPTASFLGGEEQGIFSNRPIKKDQFIAVIKLTEAPALRSATTSEGGERVVDPTALKRINQEQDDTIKALKLLSPDITVLYRYKLILNGITVLAPAALEEKIRALGSVAYIEGASEFSRPAVQVSATDIGAKLSPQNSVNFIGTEIVHKSKIKDDKGNEVPVDGRGMKVGIIDTGIDYTHAMLGGAGTPEAYKAIDPDAATSSFPNAKVVGGIDLVGTKFDSGSSDFKRHVPYPDENPLDEAGHGSHVAGTVGGLGDNLNTYSGVAPAAGLYAIKVFGAAGSTSDPVVIAALEYAADPNKDGKLNDQLDVVNLSLGSSYGNPHILYGEAIHNLSLGGTIVVASAGNSGPQDYIVGAPSVAEDAISVAASVDNAPHNWQFAAVKFITASQGEKLAEAVESPIAKAINEAGPVTGKLVYLGLAEKDLTPEESEKLKGNVAFIDRGKVTFADKLKRAAAGGAIGVVVANNQAGAAFSMGGDGKIAVPAIMITQDLGTLLKKDLEAGVSIQFLTAERIEKPSLIDTLTSFSSKGPRSLDALLKPEIAAPGQDVISAARGQGDKGVKMSGTSMAGPHIAGVMALLKQSHPQLTAQELKSLLMGQAKSISSAEGKTYPMSMQGAGRVQVDKSAAAILVADQVALSLGEVNLITSKTVRYKINLKNLSEKELLLTVRLTAEDSLKFTPLTMTVPAKGTATVPINIQILASAVKDPIKELNGILEFLQANTVVHQIPVLAIAKKISALQAQELLVQAGSEQESAGSAADILIKNTSTHAGDALAFNLLGTDGRKPNPKNDPGLNQACDLQSVGYRIVSKSLPDGSLVKVLQIAGKLFAPMTTWNSCELSVLIDSNGDKDADQELALANLETISGLARPGAANQFYSLLLDAVLARKLRADFEQSKEQSLLAENPKKAIEENYAEAVISGIPATLYNNSTVIVVEALVSELARRQSGELAIKVATIHNESSSAKMDDFLPANDWLKISLDEESHAFYGMPEHFLLKGGTSDALELTKGEGAGDLLMLYPQNRTVTSDLVTDGQSEILKPNFKN